MTNKSDSSLKLTTKDMSELFNIKVPRILKLLKENISHETKKGTYDYYIWNLNDITEDIFDIFNINFIFGTYSEFKNYIQNKVENNEKENQIKIDKKIEDKILRVELEKDNNKILKEESEILSSHLNNIWFKRTKTKYIIHIGPTNSGKTYNALKRLLECNNGVYLSPLRLLAFEVYEKILDENNSCDLITGEEKIISQNSNYSSRTVEMMDYTKEYDCVVIDECFMLGDKDRGKSWLKAIIESNAKEIHLISPLESVNLITNILSKINREYEEIVYDRLVPLKIKEEGYPYKKPLTKTIFITFSRIDVLVQKAALEKKGLNVSVLYGNLPPEVKKEQMKKFISGKNTVCVSTDVIGMGLNLPCDHICFTKIEKFDGVQTRKLTSTELKQISGRAGRYGMSDIGYVWGLNVNQKYITQKLNEDIKQISKTYYPINFETLKKLPYPTISEKLINYSKLKFIPTNLSNIIEIENISTYCNLASKSNYINKLKIDIAWKLLLLPVKKNNEYTWKEIVEKVYKNENIIYKYRTNHSINDISALESAENEVSKIELYLYFYNTSIINNYIDEEELKKLKEHRNDIIDNITTFLLNKKLSTVKKCQECKTDIGIFSPHKLCTKCYNENNGYYEDDDYLY